MDGTRFTNDTEAEQGRILRPCFFSVLHEIEPEELHAVPNHSDLRGPNHGKGIEYRDYLCLYGCFLDYNPIESFHEIIHKT